MISYHFPPVAGSSGYQRVLNFAKGLGAKGWEPIVLSVNPQAYLAVDKSDAAAAATAGIHVVRAWALDAARHLSIRGKYPGFFAWPDRWSTWRLGAMPLL